jgi:hypothetical protein
MQTLSSALRWFGQPGHVHKRFAYEASILATCLTLLGCAEKPAPTTDAAAPTEAAAFDPEPTAEASSETTSDELVPPFLTVEPAATDVEADRSDSAASESDNNRAPADEASTDAESDNHQETPADPASAAKICLPKENAPVLAATVPETASPPLASDAAPQTFLTAANEVQAPVPTSRRVGSGMPPQPMTQKLLESCLVRVGDTMPSTPLVDLSGATRHWTNFAGERGTVLLFWSGRELYSLELFTRLEHEMSKWPLSQDITVVTINVGDAPETVRELAERHRVSATCLIDPQGELFSTVATERLPRPYLIDASGRVRWFDVEWSRFTRQALAESLSKIEKTP